MSNRRYERAYVVPIRRSTDPMIPIGESLLSELGAVIVPADSKIDAALSLAVQEGYGDRFIHDGRPIVPYDSSNIPQGIVFVNHCQIRDFLGR